MHGMAGLKMSRDTRGLLRNTGRDVPAEAEANRVPWGHYQGLPLADDLQLSFRSVCEIDGSSGPKMNDMDAQQALHWHPQLPKIVRGMDSSAAIGKER